MRRAPAFFVAAFLLFLFPVDGGDGLGRAGFGPDILDLNPHSPPLHKNDIIPGDRVKYRGTNAVHLVRGVEDLDLGVELAERVTEFVGGGPVVARLLNDHCRDGIREGGPRRPVGLIPLRRIQAQPVDTRQHLRPLRLQKSLPLVLQQQHEIEHKLPESLPRYRIDSLCRS